jgi:Yip1 domain
LPGESGDVGYLFSNYVCIVSAIPPVCSFIGGTIIGYGPFHIGTVSGLLRAAVVCVLGLVGVFVMAHVINFLAKTFDSQDNLDNAMRVSAYAPTAAWVAGVFSIIPFIGILGHPRPFQHLSAAHRPRGADAAAGKQGHHLHDRRHRLHIRGLSGRLRHDGPDVI